MSVPDNRASKRASTRQNSGQIRDSRTDPQSEREFSDETAKLIDDLANVFRRYIVFDNEHDALILATQVLYTYLWNGNFYSVLYVYVIGKKGAGKTRLLELADTLVCHSSGIGVRWTEPTLFREASEKRTILFDEIHNSFGGPEEKGISSVFNAGNKYGAMVPRVDPKTGENIYWSVFGPKWFAGQDVSHTLHDDTVQRTVIIRLPHRPDASKELGTRFYPAEFRAGEASELRDRCEEWAKKATDFVPSMSSVRIPPEIDDRTAEAWIPLFVIADMGNQHAILIRNAAIDKTVSEEFLTGDTFDVAVKTAMHQGFIAATRYDNKNEPPVIGDLTPSDFGWKHKGEYRYERKRSTAFGRASVYRTDDDEIQLRMWKEDFPVFWNNVTRANSGIELPTANEILRQLRDGNPSRLRTNDPKKATRKKHLAQKNTVWASDVKQDAAVVIDITGWFSTLDNVIEIPPPNPQIEHINRILTAETEDELWGSDDNPWKEEK